MQLQQTTIRLQEPLKKSAQAKALELNISFQTLITRALQEFLQVKSDQKSQKIVFHTHDLGVPLDDLTREDIYAD